MVEETGGIEVKIIFPFFDFSPHRYSPTVEQDSKLEEEIKEKAPILAGAFFGISKIILMTLFNLISLNNDVKEV